MRSAGMPLSPDQVGIGAHPISRSIDIENPLPEARDRDGVDFLDPVEFAPDRPGLNQAVENESPIHFHRRRRSRHCVTLCQVWLTSQLGTFPRASPHLLCSFQPPFSALVSSQSNLSGEDHRFALRSFIPSPLLSVSRSLPLPVPRGGLTRYEYLVGISHFTVIIF